MSRLWRRLALAVVIALGLTACGDDSKSNRPPSAALTSDAIGHFCGMALVEHGGPKGQILLRSQKEPIWFSSAHDAVAFTLLPEEPRDIAAIYVSDMAKAPSWADPGADNWVEARDASFVIGSGRKGGMGGSEAVPFSSKEAAERFAAENGGKVVAFDQIPEDYILGSTPAPAEPPAHGSGHGQEGQP